jgi:DNA-binding transcriptional regulator LsrR (DeoR family)
MTKKEKFGDIAFLLYMQGYKQKEIAKRFKISEVTVSNWAKEDNWDALKKGVLTSKNKRISELYDELAEFNKMIQSREVGTRFPTSKEADVRRKLIRDISDLEKKYNIGQTTVIARDFVLFTQELDFEFAQKAAEYFDLFINDLINKQKWQGQ